jgi:fibronectin-binding autotransporter adhesin
MQLQIRSRQVKRRQVISALTVASAFAVISQPRVAFGQAFATWQGSGSNWSTGSNWSNGNGATYGQLQWLGGGSVTSNNDFSSLAHWRLFFNSGVAYNLTGNSVSLFDNGSNSSWVLNQGSSTPTIGLTVNFSDNGPRRGWLTTQGSGGFTLSDVGMQNSVTGINFASANTAGQITVNGVLSGASNKTVWIGRNESDATVAGTRVTFAGANTYTGVTSIDAGILNVGTISNGGVASNIGQASAGAGNIVFGGGTLRFTGTTASGTSDRAFTINNGATATIDVVGSSATLTLAGTTGTSTTGALTKAGPGTLVLTGVSTHTGETRVSAGTLQIGPAGNISSQSRVRVALGTTFDINGRTVQVPSVDEVGTNDGGSVRLGGGSLTFTGGTTGWNRFQNGIGVSGDTGTFTLNSATSNLGVYGTSTLTTLNVTDGTLNLIGDATVTTVNIASGKTMRVGDNGSGGAITATTINVNGGTLEFGRNNSYPSAVNATIANTSGSGNVTKTNAGTLILSGNNTYSGPTTVSVGTLAVASDNALGSTASGTTVASGAVLQLQGGVTVPAEALTLNGTGISGGGALVNTSGTNTFGGNVTVNSSSVRINSNAGSLSLTNGLNWQANGNALTIGGDGNTSVTGAITGVANGASTLTVATTNNGVVTLDTTSNAVSGQLMYIVNSGTLRSTTGSFMGTVVSNYPDKLRFTGNGTFNAAGTYTLGATGTNNQGIRIESASTATFSVDDTQTLTIGGAIIETGGVGNLAKSGSGTLTLAVSPSYTGTTAVTAGTLALANNVSLASNAGTTTVSNGATLATAAVGTVRGISAQGTLTPGAAGVGTLSTGNFASSAATFAFNFNAANPVRTGFNEGTFNAANIGGSVNDLIDVTGASNVLNVASFSGTLNVTGGGTFTSLPRGTYWTLMTYAGLDPAGTSITLGTMPTLGSGLEWGIVVDSLANRINLQVIPEPLTATTLLGLSGFILLRGRQRMV